MRRNHLPHGSEGILQDYTSDIIVFLIPCSETNGYCTTQALSVEHEARSTHLTAVPDIVQTSLRIDVDAFLVRCARG